MVGQKLFHQSPEDLIAVGAVVKAVPLNCSAIDPESLSACGKQHGGTVRKNTVQILRSAGDNGRVPAMPPHRFLRWKAVGIGQCYLTDLTAVCSGGEIHAKIVQCPSGKKGMRVGKAGADGPVPQFCLLYTSDAADEL